MGIVLELQRDCLNAEIRVSDILRKAKALAVKLDLSDLADWIHEELNGYSCALSELPLHRQCGGSPKFWHPYRGFCPIIVNHDRIREIVSTVYLSQSVIELESLIFSDKNNSLQYQYPAKIQEFLHERMDFQAECSLHFSGSQVNSVLDVVRNRILDWTLELEKRGIIGEGYTFDANEKREAAMITNHIHGSNIGVVGNVSGNARAEKFFNNGEVNAEILDSFLSEAANAIPALPDIIRNDVAIIVNDIRLELAGRKRSSFIKSGLDSLKKILEGAGGNLVAQAILSGIGIAVV